MRRLKLIFAVKILRLRFVNKPSSAVSISNMVIYPNLHKIVKCSDKLRVKSGRRQIKFLNHYIFIFFVFTLMNTMFAFAGPSRTTYQAKIIKPDGYPLEASSVNFKFTILDPVGSCILYSETYSSVNMSATSGLISFALGSGVKTYPVSATTFEQVFSNITPSLSCDTGGPANYAPAASDSRKIVMQFHDGNGWQTLPAMSINAVPYAMYANDSLLLNGLQATDFVQVSVVPTCTTSEAIRYNGTSFLCVAVGSGGAVTSGSVISALGYTPADGVSVTTLTSNISTVSSTVFSVSSTVTSLQNSVAASFAAVTSSQWTTSGTNIFYNTGNIGIGTNAPSAALEVSGGIKLSGAIATLDIPETTSTTGYISINGEPLLHASEDYSVFLGRRAGNLAGTGVQDTGIGHKALKSITFGYQNVAVGDFTMTDMTTGGENTAVGSEALTNSVSGVGNVAVGIQTLMNNMSDENTVVGAYALNRAGNGSKNTGTGYAVMNMLTTGSNNVGVGWMALRNIDTGSSNIAIGYNAGSNITTGSGNVVIGGNTGATFATDSNNISINDGVGNERIRVVSSGLVGIGTTTPVTKLDVSGGVRIGVETASCAAALAGTIRYNAGNVEYCNGTSWSAFGVSGAGITNFNGSTSGTQSFATGTGGTAPNFNTSNGVHTLNIPLASTGSVTAGLISNTDYATFTNKLNATSAAVISALGYTPANDAVSGSYTLKANNLSDLASVTAARTNLGLGGFATASTIDLGSASATGTLAMARLPSFMGDATIAAASNTIIFANSGVTSGMYTKVLVNAKGLVTSGTQLTNSDITTALGYTPANSATIVSSQWNTSGTTINYMNGNIGIGTTTPRARLDVSGSVAIGNLAANDAVLTIYTRDSGSASHGVVLIDKDAGYGSWQNPSGLDGIDADSSGTVTGWGPLYLNYYSTDNIDFNNGGGYSAFNGRVSVGTGDAPTAKLYIAGGTSSTAALKFVSGTLLTTPQIGAVEYDGFNFYITDGTSTRRAITTSSSSGTINNVNNINASTNMTLTPVGSVVVSATTASTNSSTGALIVNGGAGIAGALNVSGIISGSAMIKGTGFRANQGAPDAADSSTVGYAFGQDGDTGIFSPGSGTANGIISFYNNNAETMRINPGAVGIGTSNPSFPLDIQGSNAFQQRIYHASNNANDDAAIMMTRTRGTTSAAAGVQSGDSIGGMYFRAHDGTNTNTTNAYIEVEAGETHSPTNRGSIMTFASTIASAATNTEIMRIHSNGYVGIGSTAPNALLQVGPTGSQATNYNVYVGSYNSSAGQGSYVGNWASSVYWGLGPATAASDNTLRLGNAADRIGTWSGTQNLNLVMGGNLSVGSGTAATYKFLATKNFNGVSSETAAFIGGTDAGTANTGIYVVQKDNLGLSTNTSYLLNVVHNNNSKFLVTGAGNVGIGTTSPDKQLTIHSTGVDNYIHLTSSMTGTTALDGVMIGTGSSGDAAFYNRESTNMLFLTSNTERVRIDPTGNVGIGTSSPTVALDVKGWMLSQPTGANNSGLQIVTSGTKVAATGHAGWAIRGNDIVSPYNGNVGGSLAYESWTGTVVTQVMTLTPTGNIGIGTSSPTTTLHVNGTVRVVDGNQAVGRMLASDASGNAAWKQTIIHGTITSTGNSSTAIGQRVSSGVSITLPPGRWSITGMGITSAASCRADFGIRTLADAIVKYTLMPPATGDFQTATVTGYVDIAVATTYELYIGSRAACTSTIHVDNSLWELTATGVAY